jgi:hypothetical protein
VFLIVETAIALVFHAFFARQVEKISEWFKQYRRLSFGVVLPLLLLANFGMTFFFAGGGGTANNGGAANNETPPAAVTRPAPSEQELPVLREQPSSESKESSSADAGDRGDSARDSYAQPPLKGDPADETLE